MSERGFPGERGAKGDHGQHGDQGDTGLTGDRGRQGITGATGDPGERGAHGDTGGMGERGNRGPRGPSNWIPYVLMGFFVAAAFALFLAQDKQRSKDTAVTVLQNCEQIEVVKDEIRGTVNASLKRLPTLAYYKQHPDELGAAIVEAKRSVRRFAAIDCKHLPVVRKSLPAR